MYITNICCILYCSLSIYRKPKQFPFKRRHPTSDSMWLTHWLAKLELFNVYLFWIKVDEHYALNSSVTWASRRRGVVSSTTTSTWDSLHLYFVLAKTVGYIACRLQLERLNTINSETRKIRKRKWCVENVVVNVVNGVLRFRR